jgi:hypothetical protein
MHPGGQSARRAATHAGHGIGNTLDPDDLRRLAGEHQRQRPGAAVQIQHRALIAQWMGVTVRSAVWLLI